MIFALPVQAPVPFTRKAGWIWRPQRMNLNQAPAFTAIGHGSAAPFPRRRISASLTGLCIELRESPLILSFSPWEKGPLNSARSAQQPPLSHPPRGLR